MTDNKRTPPFLPQVELQTSLWTVMDPPYTDNMHSSFIKRSNPIEKCTPLDWLDC